MNAAQRNRHAALLKATGYEDVPALTLSSTEGDIPHGRELSISWLIGTVMTGLTSVVLMGAALYVSFKGQDTFSTAYEALHISAPHAGIAAGDIFDRSSRLKPVVPTRSDVEMIEASVREMVDGRSMIRNQHFTRLRATLATAGTSLSDDVPAYDPANYVSASASKGGEPDFSIDIYGAQVEGEVEVELAALPADLVPAAAVSDQAAAEFVRMMVERSYSEFDPAVFAYAPQPQPGLTELSAVQLPGNVVAGIAENLTVMAKTRLPEDGFGEAERKLTLREPTPLADLLAKNGFSDMNAANVRRALRNALPSIDVLPAKSRILIVYGPSRAGDRLIPFKLSIFFEEGGDGALKHKATVALTDDSNYVLGVPPEGVTFPEEDSEEVNVSNLPSIYRAIWETGRKHDLDDATIKRIIGMYAFDLDLTRRVTPGDTIEVLQTDPDAGGTRDLLYVGLGLNGSMVERFRFQTDDGTIDFFDPSGETGKQFLQRRPLEGGGILRSSFGYRVHPIFKTRRLHTGVDLAAKSGTPIYAAGDGVVELAGWQSGYGRKVELKHVNGYETAYGHMSRIADGIKPGVRVRQGQLIGYVGSTGNSTGPHLHFEILINGNFVDPLSVKLPKENSLPAQYEAQFDQIVAQVRDLLERDGVAPAPVTVAAAQ